LSYKGVLLKKHLQVGVNKGAISQEIADTKFEDWKVSKEAKVTGKTDGLDAAKTADKAVRMARETEINAARAAAIVKKNTVEEVVAEVEEVEAVVAEAPVAVEEVVAEVAEAPVAVEEVVAEVAEAPVAVAEEVVAEVVEAPVAVAEEVVAEVAPEAPVAE
jgi:hypothetical protein